MRDCFYTGYYKPELKASRTQKSGFNTPIYALPDDIVTVNLGHFDQDLQGKKLWGRLDDKKLKSNWNREDIHNKNTQTTRNL